MPVFAWEFEELDARECNIILFWGVIALELHSVGFRIGRIYILMVVFLGFNGLKPWGLECVVAVVLH